MCVVSEPYYLGWMVNKESVVATRIFISESQFSLAYLLPTGVSEFYYINFFKADNKVWNATCSDLKHIIKDCLAIRKYTMDKSDMEKNAIGWHWGNSILSIDRSSVYLEC